MKINIRRLAGVGFGAALAIMLSVDVEATPVNTWQGPAEISASDGLVVKVASRVRVRRSRHRTPRQMVHRHRRVPVQRAM
jgi:hypothetical protein